MLNIGFVCLRHPFGTVANDLKTIVVLSALLLLFFTAATSCADILWTAYNDCLDEGGFTQTNVTRWTIYEDYTGNYTGPLKNFATGSTAGMPTVTFSMEDEIDVSSGNGSGNPDTGTPADAIFGGIIDFSPNNILYGGSGWAQEITFSNLNPALTYTFVGTAFRDKDYEDRKTLVTISGHQSAVNNSSDGAMIFSKTPTTTIFSACNNVPVGDIVRWDDIVPSASGTFTIRSEATADSDDGYKAYPMNGFMLQATGQVNQSPQVDAGTDQEITLPTTQATMNATVTDDGLGDPDSTLDYQWSIVSGPGQVSFDPSATVEDPVAEFPLDQSGTYILRLTATDGDLEASDDIIVVVNAPVCPFGDLSGDCVVDIQDLVEFGSQWLSDPVGNADITGDNNVNFNDLLWLAEGWLQNWQKGSLQIFLYPEEARSTALWRVDNGLWHNHADIVEDLLIGDHVVEFLAIDDFDEPASQNVEILYTQSTQADGVYTPHTGSLKVSIGPGDVLPSAQWRRVGQTQWLSSGQTETDVLVGPQSVEFSLVSGWQSPSPTEVFITEDSLTTLSATYYGVNAALVINEFMAANNELSGICDEYGDFDDWIEIYNPSDDALDLGGMYVSDSQGNLCQIPTGFSAQTTVLSNGYLLLWADNEQATEGPLHLDFGLDADGDSVTLFDTNGTTVIDTIEFDSQVLVTSYGRFPDEMDNWYFFEVPTPNAENDQIGIANRVADTAFSPDRGFYTAPFEVTITTETPDAQIYYTVNCSDPIDANGSPTASAQLYNASSKPMITTTTCLRAAAIKTDAVPTNIDTQTYIFLDDVLGQATSSTGQQVTPTGYPSTWLSGGTGESVTGDYQVDPDIVNHANSEDQLTTDDLRSIPTVCVTMDIDQWFDSMDGIYVNESLNYNVAESKEYPCSFEYFDPDGSGKDIQQNCAIAMAGGVSGGGSSLNRWKTYKLSMRPRFKQVTDDGLVTGGPSKLREQIFPDSPINDFDTIVLDAVLNYSWLHSSQYTEAMYVQDQVVSDFHNAMGGYSPHGAYAHLYINGLYWGVYYIHERPDHSWAEEIFGGSKEEYDVVKHNAYIVVNDAVGGIGATNSYNAMLAAADAVSNDPTNLTKWQALEQQLNVDNLITYLLTQWFVGNTDWPDKNWYATCRLNGQWYYHNWDAEKTFTTSDNIGQSPSGIHGKLKNNAEYKMKWADQIHKHFYHEGPLSYPRSQSIYQARMTEIDQAIRGESGRWGDNRSTTPQTRTDWLNVSPLNEGYFTNRSSTVFSGLDSNTGVGLYPAIKPPDFRINGSSQYGGIVSDGDLLMITNQFFNYSIGTIWYTLDGSDPREPGGTVNPAALAFTGTAIPLTHSMHVKARFQWGSTWSAISDVVFAIDSVVENLRITEIMYHPADVPVGDPNAEFIELSNVGSSTINLALARFTNGVQLELPYLQLASGQRAVAVRDPNAFSAQYDTSGITIISATYTGSLDNNGERIVLTDALGRVIHDFKYEDGWYELTDGMGFSLTMTDPTSTDPDLWDTKAGWRSSLYEGGTPGAAAETVLPADSIVINELLAHSHSTSPDWIELYNTTAQAINIGGWFLSDDDSDDPNIMKYEIPDGAVIQANSYYVLIEDQTFGNPSAIGCNSPFGLSEAGETVYLYSGQSGQITGYYQTQQKFDASETDVSFGRYEKSELSGGYDFVRQTSQTQGSANSGPAIPDVVISEIYYNPAEGTDYEFVELYNRSGSSFTLMTEVTTETTPGNFTTEFVPWRLEGTGFEFPTNTTIPAGAYILVAKNPDMYTSASCTVYGPYDGKLDNGGEELELQMPGDQEYGSDRYWIPIEKIDYDDEPPWPTSPDGAGDSLQRIDKNTYGRDYSNWTAANPNTGQ